MEVMKHILHFLYSIRQTVIPVANVESLIIIEILYFANHIQSYIPILGYVSIQDSTHIGRTAWEGEETSLTVLVL